MSTEKPNTKKKQDDILISQIGRYMKIQKGYKNYYLDRSKYDISSLMMLLDIAKLNKLEKEFKLHSGGIAMINFIKIMINELAHDYDDRINLVYGLYKLFLEIDFNGDNTMQWEEFTQFIIDTVMGENDKVDGGDEDDLIGSGKNLSEKQLIKYKRYQTSNMVEDRSLHDTDIIDCQYGSKLDMIFCVEYKSKKIKLYNTKTGRADKVFDLEYFIKNEINAAPPNVTALSSKKAEKLKKVEQKQPLTFSILSICITSFNILAICTTYKKIYFFEFCHDQKPEFRYEISTPTLQKRIWYLPDHNVWITTGIKKEDEKYFSINELDIEFESKQSKYEPRTNIGMKIDEKTINVNPYRQILDKHDDEILDVIEIRKPNMYILTGCMDKKIRLISLNDREIVKIWTTKINSAVRCLDYNPNIGAGFILSVGFEYYINIWSPVVALDEAHYGTLDGHYSPVIACKFICGSPMCASCDDEGNVRIWDCRTKITLQLIPQEKKNFKVSRLLILNRLNRFILYGNKIIFFDPKYRDTDIKPKNEKVEENYPVAVYFNSYFLNFYVTTLKDVKIYNSKNGELVKVFKSLRSNLEGESKIRKFIFDERDRKFYLGFSSGAVQQFNAGNGSLIKKIGENEEEKDGITYVRYDHTLDVVDLFYDLRNLIFISVAYDSLINIYDERNPEECTKLRTIKGGHKMGERNNQIFAFDFSLHLNLFATGSTDGLITIWDYELSKIDDICYVKHSKPVDIFCIKFLDPYPMFVSGDSDGMIYFWCVKPSMQRGECILRGRNHIILLKKSEVNSVHQMMFIHREMNEIPRKKDKYKKAKDNMKLSGKTVNRKLQSKKSAKFLKFSRKNFRELDNNEVEVGEDDEASVELLHFDDEDEIPSIESSIYGNSVMKSYLFLGDSKGKIKLCDIRGIFKKFEIDPAPQAQIKSTYNILKKDDINVESILSHHLQKNQKPFVGLSNISKPLTVADFIAHDDSITCINMVNDPLCFLTCSKDKKFKIWSMTCELIGEVNTQPSLQQIEAKPPSDWKFKVDWEKLKEEEILEVIEIFEKIGGEPVKFDEASILDENPIELSSKIELKKKPEKNFQTNKLSRYKPLEEIKKGKTENKDDNENTANIDDQNTQEIVKRINDVINPIGLEHGLYEMSKNLLDGNKIFIKDEELKNTNKDNNFYDMRYKKYGKNVLNPDSVKNSLMQDSKFKNPIIKALHGEKKSHKVKDKNHIIFKDTSKTVGTYIKQSDSSNISRMTEKVELPSIAKNKKAKLNKDFHPFNQAVNVKFKTGETERILSFEYYKSSYDSCCNIGKRDVSNSSLRNNYKLMWNYVKEYSTIHKSKKHS